MTVMTIVSSFVVLLILGVVFGYGLAAASKKWKVDVDPKIEEIEEVLPGANCGACGYAGCSGFATAVVAEGADCDLCIPGGSDVAKAIAEIMGVTVEEKTPVKAVIHCKGGAKQAKRDFVYAGVPDCRAATLIQGGEKACKYGCLGLGTCVTACPFNALFMGENGLPIVIEEKCTGCGVCARICPRHIITTEPVDQPIYLGCSSQGKGKAVKQICEVGCIACRACVKATESGAMEWGDGNLPVLNYEKGSDFENAVEKCPQNSFAYRGKRQANSQAS